MRGAASRPVIGRGEKGSRHPQSIIIIINESAEQRPTGERLCAESPQTMEKRVTLNDRTFRLSMPEREILAAVERVAARMTAEFEGKRPLFLVVLNGAFMFAADLLKRVEITAEVTFVKLSSYCGTESSGCINEIMGLTQNVEGRTVVVIEDIVDSGLTMKRMTDILRASGAGEIRIATLLLKPAALKYDVKIDYAALEIPNDFIVGYGLDYDGLGRNLRDIYTVVE